MRAFGIWAAAALVVGAAGLTRAEGDAPKVGDRAPAFKLSASDGKIYNLEDFKGKSAVVLAWYPKAATRGCTAECNSLRDEKEALSKYKVAYFGISVDSVEANKAFSVMNSYNFPLLCDPGKDYARALGVLNPLNGVALRWTFIIDDQGVIRAIDKEVKPMSYGKDLAARLDTLAIPKK